MPHRLKDILSTIFLVNLEFKGVSLRAYNLSVKALIDSKYI